MAKHIVIAGAVPALHRTEIGAKGEVVTKTVKSGDVLDEKFFRPGEIGELTKGGFIEEYRPHKLSAADLAANPHLEKHEDLKEGDEIHAGKAGFTPAPKEEKPKETKEAKPKQ